MIQNLVMLIVESLFVGFIMSAPVGPVGLLCIRRTLRAGWWSGFITGLGVAAVDTLFAFLACLGLTSVADFVAREQHTIRLFGGLVLLVVGFQIYRSRPQSAEDHVNERQWRNFLSAFLLAITNPLTILSFAAVYLSFGLAHLVGTQPYRVAIFVGGVFSGSCLWWLLLSQGTLRFQKQMNPQRLTWINHVCGVVIAIFGIVSLVDYLRTAL